MDAAPSCYRIGLAARGLFEIADAAGLELACARGSLWITLDDDPRDVVLQPGERFSTPQHRRALVYAFEPSSLAVSRPMAAQAVPVALPAPRLAWRTAV